MTRSTPPRADDLTMVVGFDFSPLGELALQEAAALAAPTARSQIHLVWAVDLGRDWTPPEGGVADLDRAIVRLRTAAERALRALGDSLHVDVVPHVIDTDAARAILEVAEDVDADLILVGTHGRSGIQRVVLGSVAETVVRQAGCPVLVMRPHRYRLEPELQPEPPCPACEAVREQGGPHRWCAVHARPWAPPHRYSYRDASIEPFRADRTR